MPAAQLHNQPVRLAPTPGRSTSRPKIRDNGSRQWTINFVNGASSKRTSTAAANSSSLTRNLFDLHLDGPAQSTLPTTDSPNPSRSAAAARAALPITCIGASPVIARPSIVSRTGTTPVLTPGGRYTFTCTGFFEYLFHETRRGSPAVDHHAYPVQIRISLSPRPHRRASHSARSEPPRVAVNVSPVTRTIAPSPALPTRPPACLPLTGRHP
jgi:hypothetical protein